MNLKQIKDRCTEDIDCWIWISSAKSERQKRYPQIKLGSKVMLARRVAYELHHGPIGEALKIKPKCGNPYCINPEHQEAVTEREKMRQAAARGVFSAPARCAAIAKHRRANVGKITMEQAAEIRQSAESGAELSRRYGICETRISSIKRGIGWRDYSNPWQGLM